MKPFEIAKIQHWPQVMLKQFTNGKKPQAWVYDKQTGKKLKAPILLKIPKRRQPKILPEVLSRGEVSRVIDAPANLKHRLI